MTPRRAEQVVNRLFLAGCLGFAAGVMLFVSFAEIFGKSQEGFVEAGYKESIAFTLAVVLFFSGIVAIQLLDYLVHWLSDYENDFKGVTKVVLEGRDGDKPVQRGRAESGGNGDGKGASGSTQPGVVRSSSIGGSAPAGPGTNGGGNLTDVELAALTLDGKRGAETKGGGRPPGELKGDPHAQKLSKMGLMTALAIGIHNFPEGLATFLGALDDPSVGGALAVAIGIHNIPEGLSVAIPIFYSTGSRHKAFLWALLSGVSEPIGALIGYAIIVGAGGSISQLAYGILFGLVAGMMVSICIKELLPTAFRYDPDDRVVTKSVVAGMLIMALSLVLFAVATGDEEDKCNE